MKNILICTSSFDKKNLQYDLIPKSINIKFNPFGRKIKEKELLNLVDDSTIGIISGTEFISKKIILKAKNLQVISRCGTGTDNIDNYVYNTNIKIFKTEKEPVAAVAEFVLTQILSILKNSYKHNFYMKKANWKKFKGNMLSESHFGFIGYGKIGKKIRFLIKPFRCKVKIYDPKISKYSSNKNLNFILNHCKIITLNIPFNSKNKNFMNENKLKKISKDAILVNCSRGGLVDEEALYRKLKKNKKFKAILDCFRSEPYFGKLIKLENTFLSPHVASFTQETRDEMERNSFLNCINNLKIRLNEKKYY